MSIIASLLMRGTEAHYAGLAMMGTILQHKHAMAVKEGAGVEGAQCISRHTRLAF